MLHPAHARNGRWHPHFHLIIDAPETFDIAAVESDWRRVTGRRGYVKLRPADPAKGRHKAGDPGDLDEAATYITAPKDWSPENGSMDPELYDRLRQAVEGRQLLVSWGTGGRGRRPRSATTGNVSSRSLRVSSDLVAAHARLVQQVRAKHATRETTRWDNLEQRNEVLVDLVFDLGVKNDTDAGHVVHAAIREIQLETDFKPSAAAASMSVAFICLGLRGDSQGRGSLIRFLEIWLRTRLVDVRPLRPTDPRPTARLSFRLNDGPVDARGDHSQFEIVLEAIALAMLVVRTHDTTRALELVAVTLLALAEHEGWRGRPCPPEQRALILASLRRTLHVAPPPPPPDATHARHDKRSD